MTLSKDPHPTNAPFPHGACDDDHAFDERDTGCGWISADERSYYIKNGAYLKDADLTRAYLKDADLTGAGLWGADLHGADLYGAILTGAILFGVKRNSSTYCPNGKHWGTAGNDCGF